MNAAANKTETFRALHVPGAPFIIPNPWDAGSARVLESAGFKALATSSSAFAFTLGRRDYSVTRAEALAHARAVVEAVDIPVSADLENGFGDAPETAAETIRLAAEAGLAGASIEDATGDMAHPTYDLGHAVERVAAAAEAAHAGPHPIVLTARAEAFLYGSKDLDAVIARLKAFEAAGADVLYAPGLTDMNAVRTVCSAVTKPVNALLMPAFKDARLTEFAEAGAARISLGGGLAWAVFSHLLDAAEEMLSEGRFTYAADAARAGKTLQERQRKG